MSSPPLPSLDAETKEKVIYKGAKTLRFALKTLDNVADGSQIPGFKLVTGLLMKVCDAVEASHDNDEKLDDLATSIKRLADTITARVSKHPDDVEALEKLTGPFLAEVEAMTKEVLDARHEHTFRRIWYNKKTAAAIKKLIDKLSSAVNALLVKCTLHLVDSVESLQVDTRSSFHDVEHQITVLDDKVNTIPTVIRANRFSSDTNLHGAPDARFDNRANGHSQCDAHTRMEALSTIYHWIKPHDERLKAPEWPEPLVPCNPATDALIFWIEGVAGSGKSTLAQSVAHWCSSGDFLGGSFFCARDGDRSRAELIFPTIAYQLGCVCPAFRDLLAQVYEKDPHIQGTYLNEQLRKLVIEPLQAVKALPGPVHMDYVVVIDALDECKDRAVVSDVLAALCDGVMDLSPLKFVITSRPDADIISGDGFKKIQLQMAAQRFCLSDIPVIMTRRDVEVYLRKRFREIRLHFGLDERWPATEDLEGLVDLSDGLFIFAATAAKFVGDSAVNDPQSRLCSILRRGPTPPVDHPSRSRRLTYHEPLDNLYLQILQRAFPPVLEPEQTRQCKLLQGIFGALALSRVWLSQSTLAALLGETTETVRHYLGRLQSVIVPPPNDIEPVHFVHRSFADFIVDPNRCIDSDLVAIHGIGHAVLAKCCIRILRSDLRFNICDIADDTQCNSEVSDLEDRIERHIPPSLQHACYHWSYHLAHADMDEELLLSLEEFCKFNLLDWLSVLSLLRSGGDIMLDSLLSAHAAVEHLPPTPSTEAIATLLYECGQAVRSFYPAYSISWSEVYRCTLSFCPSLSPLLRQYLSNDLPPLSRGLLLRHGNRTHWSLNTVTMDAGTFRVPSVTYSRDGRLLASGSYLGYACIWDARTGIMLRKLSCSEHEGEPEDSPDRPTEQVCVAFSADNQQILCGIFHPNDGVTALHTFDVYTGEKLSSIGHEHEQEQEQEQEHVVNRVVVSPDGRYAATCSNDGEAIVWGLPDEVHEVLQYASKRPCRGISFSRDSALLFMAVHLKCTVIDAKTGQVLENGELYHTQPIVNIAVSNSDKIIASACSDGLLHLWDRGSWSRIRSISTRPCLLTQLGRRPLESTWMALDFSPDDKIIATDCALDNGAGNTLQLYDVTSGNYLTSVGAHGGGVLSLQFSPDGTQVVTAGDQFIRIWTVMPACAGLIDDSVGTGMFARAASSLSRYVVNPVNLFRSQTEESLRYADVVTRFAVFTNDGTRLATAGYNMSTKIHDLSNMSRGIGLTSAIDNSNILTTCLACSPSGRYFAAAHIDLNLLTSPRGWTLGGSYTHFKICDTTQSGWKRPLRSLDLAVDEVKKITRGLWTAAVFTQDERYVIAGDSRGHISRHALSCSRWLQWTPTSELVYSISPGADDERIYGAILTLAVSSDSTLILAGSLDIYPGDDFPSRIPPTQPPRYMQYPFHDDAFAPRNQGAFPTLRLIDASSRQVLWLENMQDVVTSLCFSSDASRALAGMRDGLVNLYDVAYMRTGISPLRARTGSGPSATLFTVPAGDRYPIEHVAFSEDGHAIVSETSYAYIGNSSEFLPSNAAKQPSSPPVLYVRDGWVYSAKGSEPAVRMGWVPPDYRYPRNTRSYSRKGTMSVNRDKIVIGTTVDGLKILQAVERDYPLQLHSERSAQVI
ncbi:WD40 repeat-like protein [Polyporus arcularius HHB13444]|uniref:WD40 repeat-like protein n=1 Tax=Polyporus arcularius HHB13444 TaxID=1314778 RepID=A0A5C3PSU6_9APHY|nr:WD40 repeat-like protein [Polyporus arcularius HHB13444]